MCDSLPEFDVIPERDRYGVPTGRYVWEVYDAASGGPITSGTSWSKARATSAGRVARDLAEVEHY